MYVLRKCFTDQNTSSSILFAINIIYEPFLSSSSRFVQLKLYNIKLQLFINVTALISAVFTSTAFTTSLQTATNMLPLDSDSLKRQLIAGGGRAGNNPIPTMLPGEWNPGMPCHWTEQTKANRRKSIAIRISFVLNFAVGIAYLSYRATQTIGKITTHPALLAYQIFFFLIEVLCMTGYIFRFFELFSFFKRNAVDFKRIPTELLAAKMTGDRIVRPEYSKYPSVAVYIPCYNEDADLVLQTVLGAIAIDYPAELLNVYLCDDRRDNRKRNMIAQLRNQYQNVFYVTRPDNLHAKAGNLNYAIDSTDSDLIVTLDADFVARPNLLQRLVPYYYVWNPKRSSTSSMTLSQSSRHRSTTGTCPHTTETRSTSALRSS